MTTNAATNARTPIGVLVGFILVSLGAGAFGMLFIGADTWTWYASINQPSIAPPNWLFGPVWTALYIMMGIAAAMVWSRRAAFEGAAQAMALFVLQLILNAIWTPVFFGLQDPTSALAVIIILWCAIVATLISFWRIDSRAGALLIPYLAWVSFATVLNYQFAQLNP